MTIPLSRVLHDFSAAPAAPSPAVLPVEAGAEATLSTVIPSAQPGEDMLAERVREARDLGEKTGREAARAEHERELAELRAQAEQQLAEERRKWAAEQGDVLAASLNSAIGMFETRIADSVAEALTPFVTAEMRGWMVRDLLESVFRLVAGGRGGRLRIGGPADLLDSLKASLGACPAEIEWMPDAEATDVTLIADDCLIRTDIANWIAQFARATG